MRSRFYAPLLLVLTGLLSGHSPSRAADAPKADAPKEVTMPRVTCAELLEAIAKRKGSVVMVEVWGDFCVPCKKKFPRLLELHKELAAKGLVIVTLDVDDDEEGERLALEFLKKTKVPFANYRLVDRPATVEAFEKSGFDISGPPIVHLFDRSGKKVGGFGAGSKDEAIDAMIRKLVEEK